MDYQGPQVPQSPDDQAAQLLSALTKQLTSTIQAVASETNGSGVDKTAVSDLSSDQEFAYITYIIFAAICLITFLVLLYITVKVIKLVGATDIIIPAMLICLQLSAISFAAFFLNQCHDLRHLNDGKPFNSCRGTIMQSISTLWLALAVLLNVNKWFYFTMRIQANINIREYEIAEMVAEEQEEMAEQRHDLPGKTGSLADSDGEREGQKVDNSGEEVEDRLQSFHLAVSDIHDLELRKLTIRKYIMHGIMALGALTITLSYSYIYAKACRNEDVYAMDSQKYEDQITHPISQLIWISFTALAVIFFTVGCWMLTRLKRYYKGFYKEYGCYLWAANILLTFPLTFRAIFDALRLSDSWSDYWFKGSNYYKYGVYNVILFIFATYIPMIMQIASLIFGFVRNKQVKVFSTYQDDQADISGRPAEESKQNSRSNQQASNMYADGSSVDGSVSSDNISSHSGNSFFDPPLENYRFYYRGNNGVQMDVAAPETGFFLQQRSQYDDDLGSETQRYGRGSKHGMSGLYGSIVSRDVSDMPASEDKDHYPQKKHTGLHKKNKSLFDEYEERGGVLEGYEDLNSRPSLEKDQVLSQMLAMQTERSHSHQPQ